MMLDVVQTLNLLFSAWCGVIQRDIDEESLNPDSSNSQQEVGTREYYIKKMDPHVFIKSNMNRLFSVLDFRYV